MGAPRSRAPRISPPGGHRNRGANPKAIVAMGKLYYVDSDGVVFKEVGPGENVQFPLLTGLPPDELGSRDPAVRRKIQDAVRLGDLMAKDSRTLSRSILRRADRVVVYTTAYPLALHMGWGDWGREAATGRPCSQALEGNEERLVTLDVSFGDQVVARVETDAAVNERSITRR